MIHISSPNSLSSLTNVVGGDIQPNAVDLRLDKVFEINDSTFTITNESKIHRGSEEILPDDENFWYLKPGTYEVVMENIINLSEGEAGWVITRSTLNRNGVFLTSGLYDSGYRGMMAGAMHITCGPLKIKKGTRVGQFLLFKSETLKLYDGDYGLGKDHDKKYEGQ
jgi:deoxycytidine triphosphate deaminase